MPATKTKKATKESAPAAKTIYAKAKVPKGPTPPPRTMEDAKKEEQNEAEAKSFRGTTQRNLLRSEDYVTGDNYSIGNKSKIEWLDAKGNRLTVTLFYPTQNVVIDYVEDEAELAAKTEAFKRLKVPYVGILPGKPLRVEEARAMLIKQGAKIV